MKRRRIEVSAVGPDDGVNFGVDAYLVEHRGIEQRTEERANKNRREIDASFEAVIEADSQRARRDDFSRFHAVDRMGHRRLG